MEFSFGSKNLVESKVEGADALALVIKMATTSECRFAKAVQSLMGKHRLDFSDVIYIDQGGILFRGGYLGKEDVVATQAKIDEREHGKKFAGMPWTGIVEHKAGYVLDYETVESSIFKVDRRMMARIQDMYTMFVGHFGGKASPLQAKVCATIEKDGKTYETMMTLKEHVETFGIVVGEDSKGFPIRSFNPYDHPSMQPKPRTSDMRTVDIDHAGTPQAKRRVNDMLDILKDINFEDLYPVEQRLAEIKLRAEFGYDKPEVLSLTIYDDLGKAGYEVTAYFDTQHADPRAEDLAEHIRSIPKLPI